MGLGHPVATAGFAGRALFGEPGGSFPSVITPGPPDPVIDAPVCPGRNEAHRSGFSSRNARVADDISPGLVTGSATREERSFESAAARVSFQI